MMNHKQIVAKAKELLKSNEYVKMVTRCGDYSIANNIEAVKFELQIWDEGEDFEVVDVVAHTK